MPKWWPISWMTVRRTWSATSCSLWQIVQIACWQMVIRSGSTPAYCEVRGAAGERDALIQPEQPGRAGVVLDRHRDIAHHLAEFFRQPVERCRHHVFEPAGFDLDHQPIVQHGRGAASPDADRIHLIAAHAADADAPARGRYAIA